MKTFLNHCLKDADYKREIQRKIFHILTILFLPLIYIFLSKKQMLLIVLPLSATILATDFYRHRIPQIGIIFNKVFGHILREEELKLNKWTGAGYMAIAAIIVFVVCPTSIIF